MKVLHVTDEDLPGRHFNGYDLLDDLATRGVAGKQAVLRKHSENPNVVALFRGQGDEELQHRLREVERRHSINNLLVPWGRVLAETSEFKDADIVHYHLIHNQVISLYDIKWLFAMKPSVWTFHDPWPLTGHCVHPVECEGWLSGCGTCPYLDRTFPIAHDRADRMWRAKQRVFADLDLDVVVASDWMLDKVKRSPLTKHFEHVHLIPFGIETRQFVPDDQKKNSRRRLGIPEDEFVVLFRATPWEFKGLSHAIDAFAAKPPARPTTLLTVDHRGLLKALRRRYRIVDLGWVDDDTLYPLVFSACDVFVMPSLAEGFGLMAVEAMAAGRPVVCFEGTAVPTVAHAPECGIAVPAGDSAALRAALDRLARDPSESARRGRLGREIVAAQYGHERYLDSIAELYGSVLWRHQEGEA
jgi:glycosyltransferase involved in cell wall biosynthesis